MVRGKRHSACPWALWSLKSWWLCTPNECLELNSYLGSFGPTWTGNRSPFRPTASKNSISGTAFACPGNTLSYWDLEVGRTGLMIGKSGKMSLKIWWLPLWHFLEKLWMSSHLKISSKMSVIYEKTILNFWTLSFICKW